MSHAFGNDIPIRHALVGGEDAVKEHALQEGHLLGIDLSTDRACLEVGAHFVQAAGHELEAKLRTVYEIQNICLPVP